MNWEENRELGVVRLHIFNSRISNSRKIPGPKKRELGGHTVLRLQKNWLWIAFASFWFKTTQWSYTYIRIMCGLLIKLRHWIKMKDSRLVRKRIVGRAHRAVSESASSRRNISSTLLKDQGSWKNITLVHSEQVWF